MKIPLLINIKILLFAFSYLLAEKISFSAELGTTKSYNLEASIITNEDKHSAVLYFYGEDTPGSFFFICDVSTGTT